MATDWGGKLAGVIIVAAVLAGVFMFIFREHIGSSGGDADTGGQGDGPLPELRDPVVVILKSAHRLTVYDGWTEVKSYRVGLGPGRGDKTREGDKCTPEGEFYVCVKNPNSRYTLSLGLSYPNIEDAERGLRDGLISRSDRDAIVAAICARRQPPWNTALGGEIMIHGHGSGSDWTLGCVALDDDDIRELYEAMPVGTPVEIRP